MSKDDAVSEDAGSEENFHAQSLKLVWAMLCEVPSQTKYERSSKLEVGTVVMIPVS